MKTILLIGNGPSTKELKEIGFENIPKNIDTFGMNSLYRYCEQINWWPTYYAAYDSRVTPFHKQYFKNMMKNNSNIKNIFSYGSLSDVDRYIRKIPPLKHLTTGGATAWLSMDMGYEKIILIGIDCNYIDYIDEAEGPGHAMYIRENPKNNPNYFFNEYQLKGDQYRRPNKSWHHDSWKDIKKINDKNKKIDIVNCSKISEITWFRNSELKKELFL